MNCPTCGQPVPGTDNRPAVPLTHPSIGGFSPAAQEAASHMTFDPSYVQATDGVGTAPAARPGGLLGAGVHPAMGANPWFQQHLNQVNNALANQGLIQATDIGSNMKGGRGFPSWFTPGQAAGTQLSAGAPAPYRGGLLGRFG